MKASIESAVAPAPSGWRPIPPIAVLLLAATLAGAGAAHAREPQQGKKPKATALSVEWKALTPAEAPPASAEEANTDAVGPSRTYLLVEQLFGRLNFRAKSSEDQKPAALIAVTATLQDEKGLPLAFQALEFSLRTSLGTLAFGSRPTSEQGKAQLVVRDRRYGKYPVQIAYAGDEAHGPSHAETLVDFGPRPTPALPPQGVLISPYPTAAIGIPFLLFYGLMWVVFFYAFGYLVLWRMRRSRPGHGSTRS